MRELHVRPTITCGTTLSLAEPALRRGGLAARALLAHRAKAAIECMAASLRLFAERARFELAVGF